MEKNHVDEIMSLMQDASKKAAIVGFGPLRVRMGVVGSRSGSREPCRGPRINKEGCLSEWLRQFIQVHEKTDSLFRATDTTLPG
jgi:hypothetical protein